MSSSFEVKSKPVGDPVAGTHNDIQAAQGKARYQYGTRTKGKLDTCTDRAREELVLGDTCRGDRSTKKFNILFDIKTLRRKIFRTGLVFSHC